MRLSTEIKAAIIALGSFAAFFWLFTFLKGRNLFEQGMTLYAISNNVAGLEPSKALTLNGLRIGRVEKIYFHPAKDGRLIIQMSVNNDFEFSKNSQLEIYSGGLLSGKEMRLLPSSQGAIAKSGDTLVCKTEVDIMTDITGKIIPLKDKMQGTLGTLDNTLNNLNGVLDDQNKANIKAMLGNLNTTIMAFKGTSSSLTATSTTADKMLIANDKKISDMLTHGDAMMVTANATMGKINNTVDKSNISATLKNLEVTTEKLNSLLTKIDKGDGTVGLLMNDKRMYENLNQTSKNLAELTKDFKENPKRYVHFSIFGGGNKSIPAPVQNQTQP